MRRGMAYMAAYAVTQSVVWGVVRHLSSELSTETLFFFRNLVGAAMVAPALYQSRLRLLKTRRLGLHAARAAAAFIGGFSIFYAVAHAPLATVVAITFSAPILASVLALFLFGERFTLGRGVTLVLCFAGVLIVLRPASLSHLPGLVAALVAAVSTAAAFLSVKALTRHDRLDTIIAYPFILILPASAAMANFHWSTPSLAQTPALIVIGAGFSAGQFFMAKAFSHAGAVAVLPFDFLRLVAAILIGAFFFSETFDLWTFAGGALILATSVYAGARRRA